MPLVDILILTSILAIGSILYFKKPNIDTSKQDNAIASLQQQLEKLERTLREEANNNRKEQFETSRASREEIAIVLKNTNDSLIKQLATLSEMNKGHSETLLKQLTQMIQLNEQKLEQVRETVENKLRNMQKDNEQKLEQMRATVDEKLHATLEKRLGDSFKIVSERLEQVHQGLGEMKTLASGVSDLKKVLTNVKTRGTWGEVQLGSLLEQIFAPEQYEKNVETKFGSGERVEFAIKLPGRNNEDRPCYIPIDAKFPQEDYQRLVDAAETGDTISLDSAAKALENRIKLEAKTIKDKYIDPPHTTDFALMFLPTEGLYAEILKNGALIDQIQREYRVVITGPTTLAAILNSLQMGFRTLAIEKRSSEVWKILGSVKTEFGKFGDLLDKTKKKLDEASNTIDDAARKSRTIERKLSGVSDLAENTTTQQSLLETLTE